MPPFLAKLAAGWKKRLGEGLWPKGQLKPGACLPPRRDGIQHEMQWAELIGLVLHPIGVLL
ncbi:MAG TPA: hypothetical protein VJK02_03325 [Anaerolineales bacterium]|nr:hypothetical protein [Anaerolineales bacterium]